MMWFENLKTSTKLVGVFGVMIALLFCVEWGGLSASSAMKANQDATFQVDFKSAVLAESMRGQKNKIGRLIRDAIIETNIAKMNEFRRQANKGDQEFHAMVDKLEALTSIESARQDLAEVKRLYPEYWAAANEAVDASPQGDSKGDPPRMMAALERTNSIGDALAAKLDQMAEAISAGAHARVAATEEQYEHNRRSSLLFGLISLVVACAAGFAIQRAIAVPLSEVVLILERVARGDLTARLNLARKDEVGQLAVSLNASLEAMTSTLLGAQGVSAQVSAAASQLASSAEQISSGAQEQAASLEETAASLEEISSTVKQNADNAQQAAQLASGARDAAERGGRVVESAVAAMSEITKSSKKIADIITTIDEIAFQTNLLALNAAVEAARAGEQGRGFGVVAAEVRTLAQRTASAAKEIRGLIADSTSKVEVGTQQVNHSGETLGEIVRSIKRVTDMVSEIAAASREQNAGVDQVNTAVTQVDQVTQGNAAQTEELSATATSLSEKAGHLEQLVAGFELGQPKGERRVVPPAIAVARRPIRVAQVAAPRKQAKSDSGVHRSLPPAPLAKAANGFEDF